MSPEEPLPNNDPQRRQESMVAQKKMTALLEEEFIRAKEHIETHNKELIALLDVLASTPEHAHPPIKQKIERMRVESKERLETYRQLEQALRDFKLLYSLMEAEAAVDETKEDYERAMSVVNDVLIKYDAALDYAEETGSPEHEEEAERLSNEFRRAQSLERHEHAELMKWLGKVKELLSFLDK